jgi:hypothetical protein
VIVLVGVQTITLGAGTAAGHDGRRSGEGAERHVAGPHEGAPVA